MELPHALNCPAADSREAHVRGLSGRRFSGRRYTYSRRRHTYGMILSRRLRLPGMTGHCYAPGHSGYLFVRELRRAVPVFVAQAPAAIAQARIEAGGSELVRRVQRLACDLGKRAVAEAEAGLSQVLREPRASERHAGRSEALREVAAMLDALLRP